jgi:peptidoglycan biosynthesis protein MviN/MurJ (putative lipid II flippase)
MVRLIRITGYLLIAAGVMAALSWLIKPLRQAWPAFRSLPVAIQLGLGAAAAGLILLFASLLWERMEERDADQELLRDEPPQPPL